MGCGVCSISQASVSRTMLFAFALFVFVARCGFALNETKAGHAALTSTPLVALWDTAHTGTDLTSASHSLLRGDQLLVTFVDKPAGEVTTSDLAAVNLYILVEPDSKDLAASEIAAIQNFMARGGHFLLLSDTNAKNPGVNSLLAGSGITQASNFSGGFESTTAITSHAITAGVGSFFVASGGRAFTIVSPAVSCVRYTSLTIVAASDCGSHRIVVIGDETSLQDQDGGTPPAHYFKDNNRTLVRNIFDWFRRGGSRGSLSLDASVYGSTGTVAIELMDNDLAPPTSATVQAQSTRGDSETVVLSALGAGHFQGALALSPQVVAPNNGVLSVADGSIISVIYHDANTGSGLPGDIRTTAVVDARPPTIRQVQVSRVGPFSARVSWQTDEPAAARVRFGLSATATTQTVERADLRTSHALELRWLEPETTYFFIVESRDRFGNLGIENAGGAGFSFRTCHTQRTGPGIRVLLLYADTTVEGVLDITAKLEADGRILQVVPWDFHAVLPDLAMLRSYDAVLVHANYSNSPNRNAVGDLLADFVESGGPVVTLNRATVEPYAIGGRFRAGGYGVVAVSNSYRENQRATIGAIHVVFHPLLDDVATFDGGPWSGHQATVVLTTGSVCVADWSDSEPLVAYRIVGATRLVGLNFFGPSADASPAHELWDPATDGARLMANALVWASRAQECDSWLAPLLAAEPPFTRGTTNTIVWQDFAQADEVEIEWSADGFTTIAGRSGWLAQSLHQWTATGLANGQTYASRLRGRSAALGYSPFSNVVQSRQDASPPQTRVLALPAYSTTVRFPIPWSGSDVVSGLASVKLFYRRGGSGPFVQYGGTYTTSPITFDSSQTGGDGSYIFYTVGLDNVGNPESVPSAPDAQTTVLTISPAAPVLGAEPPYTSGTTNWLAWTAVAGATRYYLQWSTDRSFTLVAGNSGWTTATAYLATGLSDGQRYYYRVTCRNVALLQSGWSSSVDSCQDAQAPKSCVLPLDPLILGSTFTLRCEATDTASGVKEVRLYFRFGQTGPYRQWASVFTSETLIFDVRQAVGGGPYQFYSIAKDNVNNMETAPATPDAQTVFDTTPPHPTVVRHWILYR